LQWSEVIFIPNKPSQMAPFTKGNRIYIPGSIKFCLTVGQENKIWLEKSAPLKGDYRVLIVFGTFYSCFNDLLLPHSVQTSIVLL
jgi:PAX-interacting protein 1